MPLRVNLASMSDMEIADHLKAFQEEQKRRDEAYKETAWKEFTTALHNYVSKYGFIEVQDFYGTIEYCIDKTWDLSNSGIIRKDC